jgi:hypothetical protein
MLGEITQSHIVLCFLSFVKVRRETKIKSGHEYRGGTTSEVEGERKGQTGGDKSNQ